jgi:hypothetical protein
LTFGQLGQSRLHLGHPFRLGQLLQGGIRSRTTLQFHSALFQGALSIPPRAQPIQTARASQDAQVGAQGSPSGIKGGTSQVQKNILGEVFGFGSTAQHFAGNSVHQAGMSVVENGQSL